MRPDGCVLAPGQPQLHCPWGRSREDSTAAARFGARAGPGQPSLLLVLLPQDAALRAYSEVQWAPPPRIGPFSPSSCCHLLPAAITSHLNWSPCFCPGPPRSGLHSSQSEQVPSPITPLVGSTLLLPIFISYPFPLLHSGHTGPWRLLSHPGQVPDPRPSLALLSTWDSRGTGSQGPASFAPSPTTSLGPSAIRSSDRRLASPGLL